MLEIEYNFADFFTIEEVRAHCRVEFDYDDDELKAFTEAAIEVVAGMVNGYLTKKGQTVDGFMVENSLNLNDNGYYWIVPFSKRVRAAVLLLVSDMYNNREAQTDYNTYENRALSLLVGPLRNVNVAFVG